MIHPDNVLSNAIFFYNLISSTTQSLRIVPLRSNTLYLFLYVSRSEKVRLLRCQIPI